jgi:hypothetical protein
MSVGSLSFAGVGAATPLAQAKGSDSDRVEQETSAAQNKFHSELKAEEAAGIGQTDGEDHETEDRDADGRRLWEVAPNPPEEVAAAEPSSDPDGHHVRDPHGELGNSLDLTG